MARYHGLLTRAVDHPPCPRAAGPRAVAPGSDERHEACGLTGNDVLSKLRGREVADLSELRYVRFETEGELTLVSESRVPVYPTPRCWALGS